MTSRLIVLSCALWVSGSVAHAGYQAMSLEQETYEPPRYLMEDRESGAEEPGAPPIDFEPIREELARILETATHAPAFYEPGVEPAPDALRGDYELSTLLDLVAHRNGAVRAAREREAAAREAFGQVDNLDEMVRAYAVLTESLMAGVGPMKGEPPMHKQFPFPGVTALKGRAAARTVEVARADADRVLRDTLTRARTVYWDLVYVRHARQVRGETLELLQRLERVATTRYEAGKTSFQDVIRVRVRRETAKEALTTLDEREANLQAAVRELAALEPGAVLGAPVEAQPVAGTVFPVEELTALALDHRQELRGLRAKLARMETMIEMAETMILPQWTQGYSFYADTPLLQAGTGAMQPTFATDLPASMGVGLPKMPWYGTADAWLQESRKKRDALGHQLADVEAKTRTGVRNGWFALDKAARELALFDRTVVDLSRAALDVSVRGYEGGRVGFSDVIGAYTGWLDASLGRERRNSDLAIAWAKLEQTVGKRLSARSGDDARGETK